MAARFAVLERQVEDALAAGGLGRGVVGRDVLQSAVDQTLAAFAGARRGSVRAALARLRTGVGGGAGLEADPLRRLLEALYRYWWRVEAVGLDRVPSSGRVLLVANRGGALLPYEALMIRVALATRHPAHRTSSPLVDEWLADSVLVGAILARAGIVRTTSAARRLLVRDEVVIVCPEGQRAVAKSFRERYRLRPFGRGAFARLAIETRTPIVPVAVVGAEEVQPVLARLDLPGRLLGLPTLPLTPTFPWLGLAGLVPLPTKWTLIAGDPLDVPARHAPGDATDPAAVGRLRDQVRERLQALVLEGLRRRRSLFLG